MYVRHEWPLPFLSGCDLDFSLLSMDSDCGVQAEAVRGACPGLRGLAAGIVWVTLDLPAEQLLPLWFPGSQSCVTSVNTEIHQPSHQPGTSELGGDLRERERASSEEGSILSVGKNHSNVKSQVLERKYSKDYNPTSDPCALVSTPFLQILAQKEQKGWWGIG